VDTLDREKKTLNCFDVIPFQPLRIADPRDHLARKIHGGILIS
jgi:hypothetical protein